MDEELRESVSNLWKSHAENLFSDNQAHAFTTNLVVSLLGVLRTKGLLSAPDLRQILAEAVAARDAIRPWTPPEAPARYEDLKQQPVVDIAEVRRSLGLLPEGDP